MYGVRREVPVARVTLAVDMPVRGTTAEVTLRHRRRATITPGTGATRGTKVALREVDVARWREASTTTWSGAGGGRPAHDDGDGLRLGPAGALPPGLAGPPRTNSPLREGTGGRRGEERALWRHLGPVAHQTAHALRSGLAITQGRGLGGLTPWWTARQPCGSQYVEFARERASTSDRSLHSVSPMPSARARKPSSASYPYIHRIEVSKFRNLADFSVELARSAVFVGENQVGKSNLLHALRLVLDPTLPDAYRLLRAEDFWDGLERPFGGDEITVKVFLRGFKGDAATKAILADCIVEHDPLTAALTYKFRPSRKTIADPDAVLTEDDYEFIIHGGTDEKNRVGSEVRKWLSLFVLPALRDAEEEVQSARRSLLRPLLARVRPQLDADKLDEVRERLDEAAATLLEEKPLLKLQKRINARVRKIVGPVHAVKTQFDFASSDTEQFLRSLRLFLKEEDKLRSISDASLGTVNVLFLSLLLQDLDEQRDTKSLAGALLAIEEPEAHLHPHLQRLLFRYALRRGHSVLVTTHSPHVASASPLRTLTVLRLGSKGTTAHTIATLDLEDQDEADLERYLDVTRAEMLFAKGIIFVEGPAEQYLVPAFAAHRLAKLKLGSSLDEFGITVCSISGTDFTPYWRVTAADGWAIPRVVLTDGDPNTKDPSKRDGLKRAMRLLDDQSVTKAFRDDRLKDVRSAIAAAGIFVGERTLELDLLPTLADEIRETYEELQGGEKATQQFFKAVDAALKDDAEAGLEVIRRIEAIGKGRFAQRLAGKITGEHMPPVYIKSAISHIVQLVQKA